MQITHVDVQAYSLPPASPWEDATNRVGRLEFLVVELQTRSGLRGMGLSYTVDIGGTAMLSLARDYLANLVLGMDARDYERIWERLNRQSRRLGLGLNSMAIAAFDIAVWDLIGKSTGQPLHKLLGGARDSIPAYISEINLSAEDRVEDLVARIADYRDRGYGAVKIKVGKEDFAEDLERVARVREALGPSGRLFVDLNQKWSASEAIVKAPQLDAFNLGWIEEPLLYNDVPGHAALRRAIRTPIALGESLYSRHQVLEYLRADAVDIVQADVAFVGGITEWLKIAHLAQAFGRPVAPHFMMELSLHLLCGVPNAFMLENVIGGSLTELGLLEEPIAVVNGIGVPPDRPGHGIVLNKAALKPHELTGERARAAFMGGSK
ncbi:mandelate racemase/muconate lactonizing enzyme family protein [Terrihabitans rhizophilus]|uniref:Mandelate racemase/muconate lactonizing enzyme family protein n=1 Tax=Terrihabitans rhizophilus TaxID=3092662 RepID=A0ABU4RMZ3_9HYPH|nr:mandelate racemase/muconate lactonizing enzyme family protein [Terrihabitans sp. PJ23]MDX6806192.1 mandelate racemase/muconate lactonizing enzyme family protein [Terrihabitans sp. PJ23]